VVVGIVATCCECATVVLALAMCYDGADRRAAWKFQHACVAVSCAMCGHRLEVSGCAVQAGGGTDGCAVSGLHARPAVDRLGIEAE
jgi:hypothetical protein